MEYANFVWDYVIVFLLVLTVVVFVHELGHYYLARRNGVKVEVFSVGFGPEITGWNDKHGTRWKISAVPLGGYVKMFGEYDFDEDEDGEKRPPMTPEEEAVSFHHKTVGQRAAIVAAGPFANFAFSMVVLALLFSAVGTPAPLAGVGEVVEGTAAAEAGFKAKDRIVAIDGEPIKWFDDLRRIVSAAPGRKMEFRVERSEDEIVLFATPKEHVDEDTGETIGLLGVRPDVDQVDYEQRDPFSASWLAVERTFGLATQIFSYLGQIITGEQSADKLGGPLRIAKVTGEMAQGGLIHLISFTAALSINLGLINLFPIPLLDGGHLVFYGAEALRGRPLPAKAQEYGLRMGLILVLLLMIFATWNDLADLKVFEFLMNLVT